MVIIIADVGKWLNIFFFSFLTWYSKSVNSSFPISDQIAGVVTLFYLYYY